MIKKMLGAAAATVAALGVVASLVAPIAAVAQSNPGFSNGQPPPTAAMWNSYFSAKIDYKPGALNGVPYWAAGGILRSAPVSGDCTAAASVFGCTKLGGVTPGNIFALNAGTGLSISGSNLNASNPVPSNLTLTNPASAATFTLLGGKTFTVNNTLTLSATDGSALAIGAGGTLRGAAYLGLGPGLTTSGTNAILDNPGPSTLGGVESYAAVSHQWINQISTSGVPSSAQPAFSDISGTVAPGQLPIATSSVIGGIKGDGSTLTISGPGVASCTTATTGQIGCVKPDGTTIMISGGIISSAGAAPGSILVSTQVANNSAVLQWTGLGSSYARYQLVCNGLVSATNNVQLYGQFGEGGTPTWETSNYNYAYLESSGTGTANTGSGTAASNMQFGVNGVLNNVSIGNQTLTIDFNDIASATLHKTYSSHYAYASGATDGNVATGMFGGAYVGDTNAITAIKVYASTGNLASGQCSLFAYAQ